MSRLQRHLGPAFAAGALAALVALTTTESRAAGIIKNPGQHPNYGVELEPHGLLRWDNYWWGGAGYGLGMHAVIPFLDNGPVSKINNNMGIGFGLDWAHYSTDNWYGYCFGGGGPRPLGYYCNTYGNSFLFPIYVQWNFFLTEIVSVFGEAGFGLEHDSFNLDYAGACPVNLGYGCSNTHFGPFPYFQGGGRFLFGDTVGLTVRVGWPFLTLGMSILL